MTTIADELPSDTKYLIFQVLSHPVRVKILMLIEAKELTFGSLKHEIGIESSGNLQHHLQKLSSFVTENQQNGSYVLTDIGRKALDIFGESESSGKSLRALCSIPSPSEEAGYKQVARTGRLLRLSIGFALLALTAGILAYGSLVPNQMSLKLQVDGSTASIGIVPIFILAFFTISFLIAALTKYPGCEITAVPNLFLKTKRYCPGLITPFNLPNGGLLERRGTNHKTTAIG